MRTSPVSNSPTNLQNTIKVSQKMQPTMKIKPSYSTMNMQKIQNPSFGWFGIDDLFYYYNKKLNDERDSERSSQIYAVQSKVHNDIELVAKKDGISIDEAKKKFEATLAIGGIKLNGDGKEMGLNKIVGYPKEKLTIIKDVVAPIIAKQINNYTHHKWCEDMAIPNGVVIYGSNGRGKTFFAQSLLEHFDYKKDNTMSKGLFNQLAIKTETITCRQTDPIDINNCYDIKHSFEDAKKFHEKTGGHTIIFIDDLEIITDEENNPESASEFIVQASKAAENGITWVGTLTSPKKVPQWLFMPELTSIAVQLKEMDPPEKSAVMSYFWAKNDRLDKTNHNKVILGSKKADTELTAPMFNTISEKVDGILNETKDYKTPKRGKYRAPAKTQMVLNNIQNLKDEKRRRENLEIDRLNENADEYMNYIREEYSANPES